MSLLTKEQEETLEQSRQRHEQWRGDCDAHTAEVLALVDIIDDLQARAQTQADIGEKWLEATPEQVKDELQRGFHNGGDWEPDAIIRAHQLIGKQYTEQELREWFENRPLVQDEIDALLHEVVPGENEAWYSVLKFAAHVGALKAEP